MLVSPSTKAYLESVIQKLLVHRGELEARTETTDPDTGFKTESVAKTEFACFLMPAGGDPEETIAEQEMRSGQYVLLTAWDTRIPYDATVTVSGSDGAGAWTVRLTVQGEVGELLTETHRRYICEAI